MMNSHFVLIMILATSLSHGLKIDMLDTETRSLEDYPELAPIYYDEFYLPEGVIPPSYKPKDVVKFLNEGKYPALPRH